LIGSNRQDIMIAQLACAEQRLRSKLAVEQSETLSHGSSPAGGAILIGQKCNLCKKALFYKAFLVF